MSRDATRGAQGRRVPWPAGLALLALPLLAPAPGDASASTGAAWVGPGLRAAAVGEAPADRCLRSEEVYDRTQPWALRRLAVQRSWALARGAGVVVAVLGSGVDARNGQFAVGQVLPGRSFLPEERGGRADDDCDGSGTFVAGLVAARPHPATSVAGLAPDARLLPVRVAQSADGSSSSAEADVVAAALDYAVSEGADVVALYSPTTGSLTRLSAAVLRATEAGVVVVAAGAADEAASPAEPSACTLPEVVTVAAVDGDGAVVDGSCTGATVDLAAPGAGLVSLSAGAQGPGRLGHVSVGDGAPGYAAGYVAGALALVRSYEPGLDGAAAARRLGLTADRPTSGRRDERTGWGVVNPYAALSRPVGAAPSIEPVARAPVVPATSRPAARETLPVLVALVVLTTAVLALTLEITVRAGRRRGWRPGRRPPPPPPLRERV